MPESAETKMLKEEKADRIAFYKKKAELRKLISKQDWEKKGQMTGSRMYKYLKTDDVKKNFSQPLIDSGLEMVIDFDEPIQKGEIGGMTQHWIIKMSAGFIDTDTGYTDIHSYFGEAGDSGDKGVAKAMTMAIKCWLTNEFLVIDGMDPDAEDETTQKNNFAYTGGKTKEEQKVAVSKAYNNATSLARAAYDKSKEEKAKAEAARPAEAPAKEETGTMNNPVPSEPPKASVTPTVSKQVSDPPKDVPYASAAKGIYKNWVKAHDEKKISDDKFNEVTKAYSELSDNPSVMAFATKYGSVKE